MNLIRLAPPVFTNTHIFTRIKHVFSAGNIVSFDPKQTVKRGVSTSEYLEIINLDDFQYKRSLTSRDSCAFNVSSGQRSVRGAGVVEFYSNRSDDFVRRVVMT